mmetsp:Transcript_23919/g.45440  ORF Transcript_23919/g.45440 Transcript_23919/m.45440 type:complete len:292 (+) Transcript_23919:210-1085(+)
MMALQIGMESRRWPSAPLSDPPRHSSKMILPAGFTGCCFSTGGAGTCGVSGAGPAPNKSLNMACGSTYLRPPLTSTVIPRMLRATKGASSSWDVNPTHEALISPRMYVSSPLEFFSPRMKSAVQISGLLSKGPRILSMLSSSARKGVTRCSHLLGWSYRYLAPEKRVALKASAPSAGFLCTTFTGVRFTISTRTSPSMMRGKKRWSTSMPFSPTMYCSQNVINSPRVWCSTWLSLASVHFTLVLNGTLVPEKGAMVCTRQMPSPVEPRFCFSTRSPSASICGKISLNSATL